VGSVSPNLYWIANVNFGSGFVLCPVRTVVPVRSVRLGIALRTVFVAVLLRVGSPFPIWLCFLRVFLIPCYSIVAIPCYSIVAMGSVSRPTDGTSETGKLGEKDVADPKSDPGDAPPA